MDDNILWWLKAAPLAIGWPMGNVFGALRGRWHHPLIGFAVEFACFLAAALLTQWIWRRSVERDARSRASAEEDKT